METRIDILIVGAGLAGLSLARQLLLTTNKSVLLIEKRDQIPPSRQKVGEATVQLSGYYFSKVLDLEEHLLKKHLMKYNLRFYWKTSGANDQYEDYSQSYIRNISNIASYQLDRNVVEAELLRLNSDCSRFTFCPGATALALNLADSPHRATFRHKDIKYEIEADWVVDTTGRSTALARQLKLKRPNPIRHGASFFWVEGLLNIEKLTNRSLSETLINPQRCKTGHFPVWLATNHFMGEGFWLWVIPLPEKTSLGLVYDRKRIPSEQVNCPAKLVEWICREFPLFERDLRNRRITDYGSYNDFSYDCRQTISEQKWAISGEAGRFSDPLYSPGGDLISLYNTLITDCIQSDNAGSLKSKTRLYEVMMQAFYQAYVPSYSLSYDLLADQECFALKYAWELTVYFTFLVFPFINNLLTNLEFAAAYLREFAKLGALNHGVQSFLVSYYNWKKPRRAHNTQARLFDFTELGPLRDSEQMFYKVGVSQERGVRELNAGMLNLEELARYIVAHVYATVSGKVSLLTNRRFVEELDLARLRFDAEQIYRQASEHSASDPRHKWSFDPWCVAALQDASPTQDHGQDSGIPEGRCRVLA
jgi:flavin-dependent dehydrogenase